VIRPHILGREYDRWKGQHKKSLLIVGREKLGAYKKPQAVLLDSIIGSKVNPEMK